MSGSSLSAAKGSTGGFRRFSSAPLDARQRELSERWISPRAARIGEELLRLRLLLDAALTRSGISDEDEPAAGYLKAEFSRRRKAFLNGAVKPYPLGECHSITAAVFSYLKNHAVRDPRSEFHRLGGYFEEGGVFKIIWGNVRHEFFQTSMQLGAWCVDVANDTVNIHKPKISVVRFDAPECDFFPVDTVEQYVRIKSSYHACEIRYNHLFPELAPYFPLWIRDHATGRFYLDDSSHVAALMVEQDFTFLRAEALPLLDADRIAPIRAWLDQAGKSAPIPGWLRSECLDYAGLREISLRAGIPDPSASRVLERRVAYLNHFLISAQSG